MWVLFLHLSVFLILFTLFLQSRNCLLGLNLFIALHIGLDFLDVVLANQFVEVQLDGGQ